MGSVWAIHACVVHDCTIALADQQDWFCPIHEDLKLQCCIVSCESQTEARHLTCSNLVHCAFESSREANSALFVLRRRLDRAGVSNIQTIGFTASLAAVAPIVSDTPASNSAQINQETGPALKGRTSWRWTHNEQLFVRPCEVIVSHATFFGSEGVSGVQVSINEPF